MMLRCPHLYFHFCKILWPYFCFSCWLGWRSEVVRHLSTCYFFLKITSFMFVEPHHPMKVVFKVGPWTYYKCRFSGPTPGPTEPHVLGGVRNYSTIPPGDSDIHASPRTTLGMAKTGSLNSIIAYSFIWRDSSVKYLSQSTRLSWMAICG